ILAIGARHTLSDRKRDVDEADGGAQRCGDDRLIADAALAAATIAIREREPDFAQKLKRAESAAEVVMQPDIQAEIDELRGTLAQKDDRLDEALARFQAARDGYAARGRVRAQLRDEL